MSKVSIQPVAPNRARNVKGNPARYYVDQDGTYLGAFDVSDDQLPQNATQVPTAPESAAQRWLGDRWGDLPESPMPDASDFDCLIAVLCDRSLISEVDIERKKLEMRQRSEN